MSTDETSAYLQAKLQQAQVQTPKEQQKQAQSPKVKGNKAKTQLEEKPQALVDLDAFRHLIENVVRAELQTLTIEQPQPFDVQAFQKVLRAELQPIQTAITLLANAVQAQTEALMQECGEEEDALLPTSAAAHDTDDDEIEEQQEFPPDEDEEIEDIEGKEGEDGLMDMLPRPLPPTHKLRREKGPNILVLGGGVHPTVGVRRWEPQS